MKNFNYYLMIIVGLLCCTTCIPPKIDPKLCETPDSFQVEVCDAKLVDFVSGPGLWAIGSLLLCFNEPVDYTSVKTDTTLFIDGMVDVIADSVSNDTMIVIGMFIDCSPGVSDTTCSVGLTLVGSLTGESVKAESGLVLDGDMDGEEGGDFVKKLEVSMKL